MKLQSLVIVVLRLMALIAVLQVVVHVGPQVYYFLTLVQGVGGFNAWTFAVNSLGSAFMIAAGVTLWVFAEPIARSVVRGITEEEVTVGSLTLADAYSVVFLIVAIFYIVSAIPEVVTSSHIALKSRASTQAVTTAPGSDPMVGYRMLNAYLRLFLGIGLLLNGRNWALRLARKHQSQSSD